MSDLQASFFDALERELREATERRPRHRVTWTSVPAVAAAAVALALVAVPVLAILGGGGEEMPRPAADAPPRVGTVLERGGELRTVVAVGDSARWGAWQLETYASSRLTDPETGEQYQPAGLPCLGLVLRDEGMHHSGSGQCGEFPSTPGFGRVQHSLPNTPGAGAVREIMVFGRAPERAAAVELTVDGRERQRVDTLEGPAGAPGDFYLMVVPVELANGRVNWLDAEGRPGSSGLALLPP